MIHWKRHLQVTVISVLLKDILYTFLANTFLLFYWDIFMPIFSDISLMFVTTLLLSIQNAVWLHYLQMSVRLHSRQHFLRSSFYTRLTNTSKHFVAVNSRLVNLPSAVNDTLSACFLQTGVAVLYSSRWLTAVLRTLNPRLRSNDSH